MNTQPEALWLAESLERWVRVYEPEFELGTYAAAELRRLHALNADLIHWMRYIQAQTHIGHIHDTASAAIAKAEAK